MTRGKNEVDVAMVLVRRPVRAGEPQLDSDAVVKAVMNALYAPAHHRSQEQVPSYERGLAGRTGLRLVPPQRLGVPAVRVQHRMTDKSRWYLQLSILCAVGAVLAFLYAR